MTSKMKGQISDPGVEGKPWDKGIPSRKIHDATKGGRKKHKKGNKLNPASKEAKASSNPKNLRKLKSKGEKTVRKSKTGIAFLRKRVAFKRKMKASRRLGINLYPKKKGGGFKPLKRRFLAKKNHLGENSNG